MRVVLLEKVGTLGGIGSVVSVKDGFARNFLLPRKKALRATEENLKVFESQRQQIEEANQKRKVEAETLAKTMEGLVLVVIRQAGESGHLFGSVRNADVAEAASSQGFALQKTQVMIPAPIKTLGIHDVKVLLHPEVELSVRINVAQTEEEAQAQLEAFLNPPAVEAKKSKKGHRDESVETVEAAPENQEETEAQ